MQKNSKAGQRPNQTILRRTLVLMGVCGIVAFAVLAVRLFKVQIIQHDYYESQAVEQQVREATVTASRGTVYDTNGKVLAMSASVESVYLCPYEANKYNEDVELIALRLSDILDVDKQSIVEKMQDTSSWYETVKRKIEAEPAEKVREFISEYDLKSVHIESDTKRYYPYSSLACQVIGYVGDDNSGLEGLEYIYNDYLTGTDGRVVRLKNGEGTDMLFTDFENYYDAKDGDDVQLTIDVTIQHIVEKYVSQAVIDYDVQDGAACIVMRPKTGEILAMASYFNYDLNNWSKVSGKLGEEIEKITDPKLKEEKIEEAQFRQWRNKATLDTYEPGSVFKVITMAMAVEEGVVKDTDTYYCGGTMNVLGRSIPLHCWDSDGHGTQSPKQSLQHSCNVAFATIGINLGAEKFYEYVDAFGFFDTTGFELNEGESIWWPSDVFCDPQNLSSLAAASFGQTFNITPIQLITAMSAVVNGGNLMEPYVVKQITDADGKVVVANEPTVVRQVISEETSSTMREWLEAVVCEEEGTGKNAYVAGYKVGGKTGTSEKVAQDAAGGANENIVSFCGIAPMDDPEIVVLVMLDAPSFDCGIHVSGGVMAAPVVGNIIADVLPYLGVEPRYTDDEIAYIDVPVPDVVANTVSDAKYALEEEGFTVRVIGSGSTVRDQLPAANATVSSGTEVVLYTESTKPTETVTVPNLYGYSYSEARDILDSVGLYIRASGAITSGTNSVTVQSVEAGTEVYYGSIIEVTLVDESINGRY